MNELALFAGAGGGILGGHLLGWRTVCAVEWESYPASVLCARQNDGLLPPFPIWDDVQTFDGKPWRGIVDVVSGGFPCQDISSAGKGAGITGERSSMWKHMARIIGEVQPRYAFVENSPMLTVRGLGVVVGDLSEMGYDCKWGVVSAASVGARHKRDRIWIVANAQHSRHSNEISGEHGEKICLQGKDRQTWSGSGMSKRTSGMEWRGASNRLHDAIDVANTQMLGQPSCDITTHNRSGWEVDRQLRGSSDEFGNISNPNGIGQSRQRQHGKRLSQETISDRQASVIRPICESNFWSAEPNVGRVVDGMAARVDRLKAIGNGQVPLCAATAWRILK